MALKGATMATKFDVLVAAKAMEKEISKRVKELESECKAEFKERFKADGTDRMRSTVFDPKAAYMTMRGGKPSETVTRFQMNDAQAVIDWMDEARPDTDSFATDNLAQFAQWWFEHTGECPDGCTVMTYETEPTEPTPALVVKEAAILPALLTEQQGILKEANVLMLEGDAIG